MNMNFGMGGEGLEMPMEEKKNFRQAVGNLLENSELFPVVAIPGSVTGEKMSVIDALEKNELMIYLELSGSKSDKKLDAVSCLTAIYDELEREKPDQDFIDGTIEQLKEFL